MVSQKYLLSKEILLYYEIMRRIFEKELGIL
jgi:hypothetical protein